MMAIRPPTASRGAEDLPPETRSVPEASAQLVLAPVEVGVEERAGEVIVAQVDLDAIEAGLDGHARGVAVCANDPVQVFPFHPAVINRPRPASLWVDSLSASGALAATARTGVLVTLANAQRRSRPSSRRRSVLGGALVTRVATDQWPVGTRRWSDLIGGLLLGATVALVAGHCHIGTRGGKAPTSRA